MSNTLKKCKSNPSFCSTPSNITSYFNSPVNGSRFSYLQTYQGFYPLNKGHRYRQPDTADSENKDSYISTNLSKRSNSKIVQIKGGKIARSQYQTQAQYYISNNNFSCNGNKLKIIQLKNKQYRFHSPKHYTRENCNFIPENRLLNDIENIGKNTFHNEKSHLKTTSPYNKKEKQNKQLKDPFYYYKQKMPQQYVSNPYKSKQNEDNAYSKSPHYPQPYYDQLIQKYQKQNEILQFQNNKLVKQIQKKYRNQRNLIEKIHELMGKVQSMKRAQMQQYLEYNSITLQDNILESSMNEQSSQMLLQQTIHDTNINNNRNDLSVSSFDSHLVPPMSKNEKLQDLERQFQSLLKQSFGKNGQEKIQVRIKLAKISDEMKKIRQNINLDKNSYQM